MGWDYLFVLLIAAVVSIALAPKAPQPQPPALDDVEVPTAEVGKPIGVVFGEVWCKAPNCVWYGALATQPIRKKGGKK